MITWKFIGIIAALFTTFGFIPQIIKMYRTKSSKDVSIVTLFQFCIGTMLWALYATYIKDIIIMIANIISFISIIISIIFYYRYSIKTPITKE